MADDPRMHSAARRFVRQQVLAEETHCALCGLPVDKSLDYLDPGAPEVDEILPTSLGGDPTDRANCRLTHRRCNQSRGNGRGKARKPSRVW